MKTIEERKIILGTEIIKLQKEGWLVNDRTDTTCQFTKDMGPNGCLGVILCLLFLLPGILYFIFAKNTKTLFISINENGECDKKIQGEKEKYVVDNTRYDYIDKNGKIKKDYHPDVAKKYNWTRI